MSITLGVEESDFRASVDADLSDKMLPSCGVDFSAFSSVVARFIGMLFENIKGCVKVQERLRQLHECHRELDILNPVAQF